MIRPKTGRLILSCDWSQQEIAIAAALSGDELLIKAFLSGDVYITIAKEARAVPSDGTKKRHPVERQAYKAVVVGLSYGKGKTALGVDIWMDVGGRDGRPTLTQEEAAYRTGGIYDWQGHLLAVLGLDCRGDRADEDARILADHRWLDPLRRRRAAHLDHRPVELPDPVGRRVDAPAGHRRAGEDRPRRDLLTPRRHLSEHRTVEAGADRESLIGIMNEAAVSICEHNIPIPVPRGTGAGGRCIGQNLIIMIQVIGVP